MAPGCQYEFRCIWHHKKGDTIPMYPWRDDHSTSISACKVRGIKARVQISKREIHTHIYLDYARVDFYFRLIFYIYIYIKGDIVVIVVEFMVWLHGLYAYLACEDWMIFLYFVIVCFFFICLVDVSIVGLPWLESWNYNYNVV